MYQAKKIQILNCKMEFEVPLKAEEGTVKGSQETCDPVFFFSLFALFDQCESLHRCCGQIRDKCDWLDQEPFWWKNKQTENVWNVLWPMNLNVSRGLSTTGGHGSIKQHSLLLCMLSLPFKEKELPPFYFMPLDVPADYGREEPCTLVSFFVIVGPKAVFFPFRCKA